MTSRDETSISTHREQLLEQLADYAHEAWSGWMTYLFQKSSRGPEGEITIPSHLARRWERQTASGYGELSEGERESDRIEARKMMRIVGLALGDDWLAREATDVNRPEANVSIERLVEILRSYSEHSVEHQSYRYSRRYSRMWMDIAASRIETLVEETRRSADARLDARCEATQLQHDAFVLHGVIAMRESERNDLRDKALRLARENLLLRAEVQESNTHSEPCESVYFVLRSKGSSVYPDTVCSEPKCGTGERHAHVGEPCPRLACNGKMIEEKE